VLQTSILRIPKTHNRTSLQVWHADVLHFCSFCKPTFSGATREWDSLYILRLGMKTLDLYYAYMCACTLLLWRLSQHSPPISVIDLLDCITLHS
jgi:hypothetical protein